MIEMTNKEIIENIVSLMVVKDPLKTDGTLLGVQCEIGSVSQIIASLLSKDQSVTNKNKKYPLIAVSYPFIEDSATGPYETIRIDRIVIATLSKPFSLGKTRYNAGGTFKGILIPCYKEFFNQMARSPYTLGQHISFFTHKKIDNPGEQEVANGTNDFVDCIEVLNLEIKINQIKNC